MGMASAQTGWTIDMLDTLPDGSDRHELIDGELFVTPAPGEGHQLVVFELITRLRNYLEGRGAGLALGAPTDVWRDERMKNRVQPDVFVLRVIDGRRPQYPYHLRDLLLAVEVASPSNPLLDYQVKRDVYLRAGLEEYWVVNTEARNVSRWRGRDDPGDLLSGRLEWLPPGAVSPFVLDLASFFDETLR